MDKEKRKTQALIILGFIVAISFLLFLSFKDSFHSNKFGDEIRIDNISHYYKNMPQTTKDSIFNTLYNTVSDNLLDKSLIPKNGALVRDNYAQNNYNNKTDIYSGSFVVDIESIQQSYLISFEWSNNDNNPYLSGHSVSISCPSEELNKYNFNCKEDAQVYKQLALKYPLIQSLPIDVEYYSNNYTSYTKYSITYSVSDNNEVIIKISDYSGNCYEKAIKSISDRGYNPDDYTIEYNDQSTQSLPRLSE